MQDPFGYIEEELEKPMPFPVIHILTKKDGIISKAKEDEDIHDFWLIQDALGG